MANQITATDRDVISRSTSTKPPSSYMVKIQSFSLLARHDIQGYTSVDFEAGGHKWQLILHPNGNKSKDIDDHISVYLKLYLPANGSSLLPAGAEVHAGFQFFLFDHNNDHYLVVQGRPRRFHRLNDEWGIDHFISLENFMNTSNGYLSNDSCVFGAEVYVIQETQKVECISMVQNPISYTHTWKIYNFSELRRFTESVIFTVGNQKWKIRMYPKGNGNGTGTHISLFLFLGDLTSLLPGSQILAEFTFRILDQDSHNSQHYLRKAKVWFNELFFYNLGWSTFIAISDMNSPNKGYIKNNTCIIEAEVTVHGVSKAF